MKDILSTFPQPTRDENKSNKEREEREREREREREKNKRTQRKEIEFHVQFLLRFIIRSDGEETVAPFRSGVLVLISLSVFGFIHFLFNLISFD